MKLSTLTVTKNRPLQLINNAANSLLNQNSQEFEWIVVSDGKNSATQEAIVDLKVNADFPISFWTAESSSTEFGLCVGQNLALTKAKGQYVLLHLATLASTHSNLAWAIELVISKTICLKSVFYF